MIQSQFYPTAGQAQGYELTDSISNIDYGSLSENPFKPYVMGYVKHEDYPTFLDTSTVASTADSITITSNVATSNHAWGFTASKDTFFSNYMANSFYVYDNNGVWSPKYYSYTNIPTVSLINSGYLANYTVSAYITIRLWLSVGDSRGGENTLNLTINNFMDFLNGDSYIQFRKGSAMYIIRMSSLDEESGVFVYNNERFIAITGIYWNDRGTGNGSGGSLAIQPFIEVNSEAQKIYQVFNGFPASFMDIRLNTDNMTISNALTVNGEYLLFGISGVLNRDTIDSWARDNTEDKRYVPEIHAFREYTGGNTWRIVPIFHPNGIKTLLNMRLKTATNVTAYEGVVPANYSYTDNYANIRTNLYSEEDVPLLDSANATPYSQLEADLRPWQKINTDITANEFDYDDIPEYPPSPDGDDNTESGDKIPNQFGRTVGVTSNFVTNYLMTEGQISKLGEVLWTSWADDAVTMDMVNNFYGKLHDSTGSWNVSDALQFIVSCRLFPCSLATLVNTTQVTSIPIGTGAFALQCGTSSEPKFFIANEATAILNCGEIEIRRVYNDYRDFENTKITAYLPFCGSVELNPQDVVGKWLGCTYAIDLFDGSCKAFIYTLSGDDVGYEGAYYNVAIKQGQCGFLIPLSATQAGQVASRQKVDGYTDGALLFNAGMSVIGAALESASGGSPDTSIMKAISTIGNYGFQSDILSAQRSGRPGIAAPYLSGGSGFTDFHQPASAYIQIRRSYYQEPIEYEHSAGYPVNAQRYGNLSQFTGFVICHNVDISGFTCHEDERAEIKALLESGVYL